FEQPDERLGRPGGVRLLRVVAVGGDELRAVLADHVRTAAGQAGAAGGVLIGEAVGVPEVPDEVGVEHRDQVRRGDVVRQPRAAAAARDAAVLLDLGADPVRHELEVAVRGERAARVVGPPGERATERILVERRRAAAAGGARAAGAGRSTLAAGAAGGLRAARPGRAAGGFRAAGPRNAAGRGRPAGARRPAGRLGPAGRRRAAGPIAAAGGLRAAGPRNAAGRGRPAGARRPAGRLGPAAGSPLRCSLERPPRSRRTARQAKGKLGAKTYQANELGASLTS